MKDKKFTEVYNDYNKLVMRVILDKCNDINIGKRILHKTFAAYFRNMDHIQEVLIKPWLMLTARNEVMNFLRKRRIREGKFAALYSNSNAVVSEGEAKQDANSKQNRIMEDLRAENEDWYEAVEAVCILRMSQKEAAKYLRISPQALRIELYRARAYIREKYRSEFVKQGVMEVS